MIYSSMKPMPYVYICVQKYTGNFYIGYRERNVSIGVPSSDDLGILYFTSGVIKKEDFHNYEYYILAEFFDPIEAYWHEQLLIKEHWDNPNLLNKQYYDRDSSRGLFRHTGKTSGFTGRKHTDETKKKMSVPLTNEQKHKISEKLSGENHPNFGKKFSDETKQKISKSREKYKGKDHPCFGKSRSDETKKKLSIANSGKVISEETKQKMRDAASSRPPQSEESRRKRSDTLKAYWASKRHEDT